MTTTADDYSPAHTEDAPGQAISFEGMPLRWISPSPLNPRKRFDEEALAQLAESIRTHGLLEPLVVREVLGPEAAGPARDPRYTIVAGERRYRAALQAGLAEVPVRILQDIDDRKHLELALLENLQRQDLDPLEEAAGYKALREIGYTQTQIAAAVQRSQPAIAKQLALLDLPEDVQGLISTGQLSPTHGAALASRYRDFPAVASAIAQMAIQGRWTAKDLESDLSQPWGLEREGVIVNVGRAHFDAAICRDCPFGALRAGGWCLKPAHFAQLQAAAQAQQEKAAAGAIVAAQERLAAAGKPDVTVTRQADLDWRTYENLAYGRLPDGCTDACPCRGIAIDARGAEVPICTRPERYRRLSTAAARAASKDKRAADAAQWDILSAHITGLQGIGRRELAVLVAAALGSAIGGAADARVAAAYIPTMGDALKERTYEQVRLSSLPTLAQAMPLHLVQMALAVLLHRDLTEEHSSHRLTRWYMDAAGLSAAQRAAVEASTSVERVAQPDLDAILAADDEDADDEIEQLDEDLERSDEE